MAQITSKPLFFSHALVNSCPSRSSQPCRSRLSVTTWEGKISGRAVWLVIAVFVLLTPLHSLPMVLMSSLPQNGSFHPSSCVQSHRCSMAEAGLLEETSVYKDLDLEKTYKSRKYPTNAKEQHNVSACSGELC